MKRIMKRNTNRLPGKSIHKYVSIAYRVILLGSCSAIGIFIGIILYHLSASPEYSPRYDTILLPLYAGPAILQSIGPSSGHEWAGFNRICFSIFYAILFPLIANVAYVKNRGRYLRKLGLGLLIYGIFGFMLGTISLHLWHVLG